MTTVPDTLDTPPTTETTLPPLPPLSSKTLTPSQKSLLKTTFAEHPDISALLSRTWLSSDTINTYLTLLTPLHPTILFLNTYFWSTLTKDGYARVKRWTRRYKKGIYGFTKVVIPIHTGCHWCLLTIDNSTRTIAYYDSLPNDPTSKFRTLLTYLASEHADKATGNLPPYSTHHAKCPQQTDGSSCGIWLGLFIRKFIGDDVCLDVEEFRWKLAWELVAGCVG
ncbi:hypothetical protein SpCBS45565_g01156 [Spizellomyces sp. 'palustris']|nr:hypothetical protein SpCBS45565_g01156 [Spizellomyces sp. 'palustris']